LVTPGFRPTRGSGLGAATDMSGVGAGPPAMVTSEPDVAHALSAASAIASDRAGTSDSRFTERLRSETCGRVANANVRDGHLTGDPASLAISTGPVGPVVGGR